MISHIREEFFSQHLMLLLLLVRIYVYFILARSGGERRGRQKRRGAGVRRTVRLCLSEWRNIPRDEMLSDPLMEIAARDSGGPHAKKKEEEEKKPRIAALL